MSKTIRHPDVVTERMRVIADQIAWLRQSLAIAEDELRQMIEISHQMMSDRKESQ
jgi:hypothetical protein